MKKGVFFALALLATLLLGSPAGASTTHVVDDDGAGTTVDCDDPAPSFTTIGAAVTAATAGDTVQVCPGTYPELVVVNKALTLNGAQAGVDARGRVASESIVTGSAGSTAFYVTADGVTIDGFTVKDQTNVNLFGAGVVLGAGTSGATIVNDILTNNVVGLFLANDGDAGQTLIQHNWFDSNNTTGAASSHGIYTDQYVAGGTVQDVSIDENLFEGHDGQGIGFSSTDDSMPATDLSITENTFDGNGRGMYAFNLTSSEISGNLFQNSTFAATADLRIFEGSSDLWIHHNILTGGAGRAYRASDLGTGSGVPSDIHLNRNSITAYSGPAGTVENDAGMPALDAECNWWGGIAGPGGTNSTVSGDVDAQPWLTSADLDGDCIGGSFTFQGFFRPVDNPPALNVVRAGRSVPVKWRLLDANQVPIDDPSSFVSLVSYPIDCTTLASTGASTPAGFVGSSGLQAGGDGNWQFNWATQASYAGTCRTLVLTVADGTQHSAHFRFT